MFETAQVQADALMYVTLLVMRYALACVRLFIMLFVLIHCHACDCSTTAVIVPWHGTGFCTMLRHSFFAFEDSSIRYDCVAVYTVTALVRYS